MILVLVLIIIIIISSSSSSSSIVRLIYLYSGAILLTVLLSVLLIMYVLRLKNKSVTGDSSLCVLYGEAVLMDLLPEGGSFRGYCRAKS